jgi:hypothetical protein
MKRSRFLKMLGLGIAATPVVVPLAVKVVTDIARKPAPKPLLTGQGLMAQIEAMSNEPQTYTMLTGKQGMMAFDDAMKDFAMEGERKMMYGKKYKKRYS